MLRIRFILALTLALFAAPGVHAPARAARPAAPDRIESLVAHGSQKGQYLAIVVREPKSDGTLLPVTTVHYRPMGGAPDSWVPFARFDARVLALAEWGGDLAVLLETAQSGAGRTQLRIIHNPLDRSQGAVDVPAPPLPAGVTLTDVAGGTAGGTLLALGELDSQAAVWSLAGTQWQKLPPLPPQVADLDATAMDLGSNGGRAILAARSEAGILVYEQAVEEWRLLGFVTAEREEQFLVVDGGELAVVMLYLWGEGDRLVQFERPGAATRAARREGAEMPAGRSVPIEFAVPETARLNMGAADPRTAGMAVGTLRLERAVVRQERSGPGKPIVLELALDPATLEPIGDGKAVILSFPSMTPQEIRDQILMLALYGLLIVAVVAVLRQRPTPSAERLRDMAELLAPLSLRAAAGIVDALPLAIAAATWWLARDWIGATGQWMILVVGAVVYFGHVMTAEAATGRSLGKVLFGLKVVKTDGTAPGPGAIVLRNLLRPLDVPTLGLGLALLNPLQQRIGDMAAGTTVIRVVKP